LKENRVQSEIVMERKSGNRPGFGACELRFGDPGWGPGLGIAELKALDKG
jgi:hypothetical protein